jgi:hypothetical protein
VTVATTVCAPPVDVMAHAPAPPVTAHDGRVVAEMTTFAERDP